MDDPAALQDAPPADAPPEDPTAAPRAPEVRAGADGPPNTPPPVAAQAWGVGPAPDVRKEEAMATKPTDPLAREKPAEDARTPWEELLAGHAAWQQETADLPVEYRPDAVVLEPCDNFKGRILENIVRGVLTGASGWTVTFSSKVGGRFVAVIE